MSSVASVIDGALSFRHCPQSAIELLLRICVAMTFFGHGYLATKVEGRTRNAMITRVVSGLISLLTTIRCSGPPAVCRLNRVGSRISEWSASAASSVHLSCDSVSFNAILRSSR